MTPSLSFLRKATTLALSVVLAAVLLGGVGDGATIDTRGFSAADVYYDVGTPIKSPASVDPPGAVGYASNGFDLDGWATFVPPTATLTPSPTLVPTAVLDSPRVGVRPRTSDGETSTIRATVCQAQYEWPCDWAVAVVWCEASNVPDAYNSAGSYMGWFQIDTTHGFTKEQLNDPVFNTEVAYGLWLSGGAEHWPNCP